MTPTQPSVGQPTAKRMPVRVDDMALIDGPKCAAIGDMSPSWWYREVAEGRAPKPAIRRPKCTRWRTVDVLTFWERFTKAGGREHKGAPA